MSNFKEKTRSFLKRFGVSGAAEQLIREAKQDTLLRDHLLKLGAQQEVRNALTSGRHTESETVSVPQMPAEARRVAKERFMDRYTLFGGEITLAEADAKDLAKSANRHREHSEGHKRSEAFERDIASRLPAGKKTKEVMTDAKLVELKKQHKI